MLLLTLSETYIYIPNYTASHPSRHHQRSTELPLSEEAKKIMGLWNLSRDPITRKIHCTLYLPAPLSYYACRFPTPPTGSNCSWGGEEVPHALGPSHHLLRPIRVRRSLLRGRPELGRSRASTDRHRSVCASAAVWSVPGACLCSSALSWIRSACSPRFQNEGMFT